MYENINEYITKENSYSGNTYAIFQLAHGKEESRYMRFQGLESVTEEYKYPHGEDYEMIYYNEVGNNILIDLDEIYERFNQDTRSTKGYFGDSLSISDVIMVKNKETMEAYYCDTNGFILLDERYLNEKVMMRFQAGITIKEEYDLLNKIPKYEQSEVVKERKSYIKAQYAFLFQEAKPIQYFVAEAMEFRILGKVYENLNTIEEAIQIYKKIPEYLHTMGNGIGAIVNDEEYSLLENGRVDALEFYEDEIRNNEEIRKAIKTLKLFEANQTIMSYEKKGYEFIEREQYSDRKSVV